jgi:hypothetical protein
VTDHRDPVSLVEWAGVISGFIILALIVRYGIAGPLVSLAEREPEPTVAELRADIVSEPNHGR